MEEIQEVPSFSESGRRKKGRKNDKDKLSQDSRESRYSKDKLLDSKKKRKKKTSLDDSDVDYENRHSAQSDLQRSSGQSNDVFKKSLENEDEDEMWKNSETSTPKMSRSLEDIGEGDAEIAEVTPSNDATKDKEDKRLRSGKPQIWIRLRPSPRIQDNLFDVTDDGKGIVMLPALTRGGHSKTYRQHRDEEGYNFFCDGVLKNSSQEETYQSIAHELVGKAMEGLSGLIIGVGPEVSGKNFSLFGSTSKFQYRGIIPRSLERIFQVCSARSSEMRYLVRMAIIEIRNDKIRDLLTLGSYEGNTFENEATNGMIFQKIGAAEHGFGLLIRALTCQKEIHREPYVKSHTVVFIDIYGESFSAVPGETPVVVKSRITFAKTAPIPERDVLFPPAKHKSDCGNNECRTCSSNNNKKDLAPNQKGKHNNYTCSTCTGLSCSKRKIGPIAEAIQVRQDIGFLEQMCNRACQYQKLAQYYEGAYGKSLHTGYVPPPRSQLFRLSKLTYCLKDIVSGNSEIRILLHIRPERRFKHASLEAMRFAEKAKCVPYGIPEEYQVDGEKRRHASFSLTRDDLSMKEFLTKLPPEISDMYIQVHPGTFKSGVDNAGAYFGGKVHAVETLGEAQTQCLFEKFQNLWTYVMETGSFPAERPAFKVQSIESLDHIRKDQSPGSGKKHKSTNALNKVKSSTKKTKEDKPKSKKLKGTKSKGNTEEDLQASLRSGSAFDMPAVDKTLTPGPSDITATPAQSQSIMKLSEQEKTPAESSASVRTFEQKGEDIAAGADKSEIISTPLDPKEAPSKEEAWAEFLSTDKGTSLETDIRTNTKLLKDVATEHSDLIRQASSFQNRLTSHHADLNVIQQDRYLRGDEYDDNGNVIIIPREKQIIQEIKQLESSKTQAADKMKDVRARVQLLKSMIESNKLDAEVAFHQFALQTYGAAFDETGKLERFAGTGEETNFGGLGDAVKEDDQDRIRKFEDIKRVAKKQARFFLKALAKKPSWVPY